MSGAGFMRGQTGGPARRQPGKHVRSNRIKMPKRQMFGRAGFELLRKRVLLA